MNKKEIKRQKIKEAVSRGLNSCKSIKEFNEYLNTLMPLLNEYGEDLLNEFYNYESVFLNKLKKHNYVVNPDNTNVVLFVPGMYLKSLKTNFKKTVHQPFAIYYRVNYYPIENYLIKNESVLNEYINVLKSNYYNIADTVCIPRFLYLPCYMASFLKSDNKIATIAQGKGSFNNMNEQEQEYLYKSIFKKLKEEKCPQYVIENDAFLQDKFATSPKLKALIKDILTSDVYDKRQEEELFKLLKSKYTNIDDWFNDFYIANRKNSLSKMNFASKILLTIYVKKIALQMGLDKCKVNVFSYDLEYSGSANKNENSVSLSLNNFYLTGEKLLNVIFHEITHLIQYKNMKELNVDKDPDIDVYIKDEVIQQVYGREYYTRNYYKIASEVTARYNADMLSAKYNNENDEIFDYYKEIGKQEIEKNFSNINEQEIDVEHINKRYITLISNNRKQEYSKDLNEIFLMALNKLNNSDKKTLEKVLNEHSLIKYDYNIGSKIERKNIKELVDLLENCNDSKDREIYKYLLLQRLKKDKNTKKEIKEYCDYLRKVHKETPNEELKENLRQILAKDISLRVKKVNVHG